jgi:DNA-binding NarL/FixJ family response regulator
VARRAATATLRVVVADSSILSRSGAVAAIGEEADLEVVGVASNGAEAVTLAEARAPDVVLLDVSLRDGSGLPTLREIRRSRHGPLVVVLTAVDDPDLVDAALEAGASGYLLKDVEPAVLVAAIRSAPRGGIALSPMIAARLVRSGPAAGHQLTPRERQVVRLAADGLSNKQIARVLGISDKTVKVHFGRIFHRLGVTDRTQAAVWAVKHLVHEIPA